MLKRKLTVILFILFSSATTIAQTKIVDNPATVSPDYPAALLELHSTNKGLLLTRVALVSTTSIAPLNEAFSLPAGMEVYNTATSGTGPTAVTPGVYYYNGTVWVREDGANNWTLVGNTGTTPGLNFIGTTDNVGFQVNTNNTPRMFVTNTGNVGIGTITPSQLLDVNGNATITGAAKIGNTNYDGTKLMVSDANRLLGGTPQPTSVEVLSSIADVNNLLHMDDNNTTARGGCILSNSETGNWADNMLGFLNDGSGFTHNYYLPGFTGRTTDAGWSYIVAQGKNIKGLGLLTNLAEPVVLGTNNIARLTVTGAGDVGIGTNTPGNKVEIVSNVAGTSGLTLTNLTAISAVNGSVLSIDPNTKAVILVPAGSGTTGNFWSLTGNALTVPGTATGDNFMGTTDDEDVVFARNGIQSGILQRGDNIIGGPGNTAWGVGSLNPATTGRLNVANGYQALHANTSGSMNVANGYQALALNTTGTVNVANGYQALYSNTTGGLNVANGYQALFANQTGTANVAEGNEALSANINGQLNIAIGNYSMRSNTSGTANVALGDQELENNTQGSYNVAVGVEALDGVVIGTRNTAIGNDAGPDGDLTNTTAIGDEANVAQSNTMMFGNGSIVGWGFGNSQPTTDHVFIVGSSGSLNGNGAYLSSGGDWTNTSDRNLKDNITPLNGEDILARIKALPVTKWRYKGSAEYHIGPMAQDFYKEFSLGSDDKHIASTDPAGVALIGIQQLTIEVDTLKTANTAAQQTITTLQQQIDALKAAVNQLQSAMAAKKD